MRSSKAPELKPTKMSYKSDGTYWVKTPEYRSEFHLDITKKNTLAC